MGEVVQLPDGAMGADPDRLQPLFGAGDLLPLWVAEPYLPIASPIVDALTEADDDTQEDR